MGFVILMESTGFRSFDFEFLAFGIPYLRLKIISKRNERQNTGNLNTDTKDGMLADVVVINLN